MRIKLLCYRCQKCFVADQYHTNRTCWKNSCHADIVNIVCFFHSRIRQHQVFQKKTRYFVLNYYNIYSSRIVLLCNTINKYNNIWILYIIRLYNYHNISTRQNTCCKTQKTNAKFLSGDLVFARRARHKHAVP